MAAFRAVNEYGLDAELAAKLNEKYDPKLEADARSWIESKGISVRGDFGSALKDGRVLCQLVNKVGGNVRIYEGNMPFKQMENVSNFISACRKLGVRESDLFTTVALFELKDLGQVVSCILALKRVTSGGGGRGTGRGGNKVQSVRNLNFGSYGLMDNKPSSSVSETNRGKFGWGRKSVGRNPNASVSKLNQGSHGFMQKTVDRQPVSESNRANFAKSGTFHNPNASVSRLNQGSHGFMDRTTNLKPVNESNRATYAKSGKFPNPNASISKLNNGSYGFMQRAVDREPLSETNRAGFAKGTTSRWSWKRK